MLGFERLDHAAVTISGIELTEKIEKGSSRPASSVVCKASMSELWSAVLDA